MVSPFYELGKPSLFLCLFLDDYLFFFVLQCLNAVMGSALLTSATGSDSTSS